VTDFIEAKYDLPGHLDPVNCLAHCMSFLRTP